MILYKQTYFLNRILGEHLKSILPLINSSSKRNYIKDYDKKKKLLPEDITYKHDDDRFLKGPTYSDEPYIHPTEDEIVELTKIKSDTEISRSLNHTVDPTQAPYNEILENFPDNGKFTKVEPVKTEGLWFWVERLMPKRSIPIDQVKWDHRLGLPPIPKTPPNLPYFVSRTRSNVYPIYRTYEVVGRDNKTYWKNRWDGVYNKYHTDILQNLDEIKFENNEKTIIITQVGKVQGDIWKFENDLRKYLSNLIDSRKETNDKDVGELFDNTKLLSSVSEVNNIVRFKGDFVQDVYQFLVEKGF